MNTRIAGMVLACSSCLSFGAAITADLSAVKAGPIAVVSSDGSLAVRWQAGGGRQWEADFALDSAKPLITAITVACEQALRPCGNCWLSTDDVCRA